MTHRFRPHSGSQARQAAVCNKVSPGTPAAVPVVLQLCFALPDGGLMRACSLGSRSPGVLALSGCAQMPQDTDRSPHWALPWHVRFTQRRSRALSCSPLQRDAPLLACIWQQQRIPSDRPAMQLYQPGVRSRTHTEFTSKPSGYCEKSYLDCPHRKQQVDKSVGGVSDECDDAVL
ncbi:hypothetical protein NDU88_005739 [Pleurodeles waltl]|uniref:Uncharacterized protein n=1 Tax=Pleurodeles waltl TaxID=8319 RepID=A0AAV7NN82_PLEWA|nr:hypothetical protein NDU88_005739 [Pleurodeles waltl]